MEQAAVADVRGPATAEWQTEMPPWAQGEEPGGAGGDGPERLRSDRPEPADDELPRWEQVHERLVELAQAQAQGDYEQGRWLLAGLRERVHEQLGFGSYLEYTGRLFGYGKRDIAERLRVAKAVEQLPRLSQALASGQLSWSAVRELSRVAIAETEQEWLAAARDQTVRQIEKAVAARRPGDRPTDPAAERPRRHRLGFEVSAEALALWREAQGELTRQVGHSLSDDELLGAMARAVLGGPADEGRASYQIALTVCECCRQGWQEGRGEQLAVEPEVVEKAECDAQWIGRVDAAARTGVRAGEDASAAEPSSDGQPDAGGEPATHVGRGCERGQATAPTRPHARQSIPPAVRRQVLRRFGGKCAVPGCEHADWLELHHLRYRADGRTRVEDVIPLCGCGHHGAAHTGTLIVEGDAATGLRFLHADGSPYGSAVRPPQAWARADDTSTVDPTPAAGDHDVMHTAEQALCHLGFRRADVARALRQIQAAPAESAAQSGTHVGTTRADGPVQTVVRRALAMLTN